MKKTNKSKRSFLARIIQGIIINSVICLIFFSLGVSEVLDTLYMPTATPTPTSFFDVYAQKLVSTVSAFVEQVSTDTPSPTVTPTMSATSSPTLVPTPRPEDLICESKDCPLGVAYYQVWIDGYIQMGYSHEIGVDADNVLSVDVDARLLPGATDSWGGAQVYGAWQYEFIDAPTRVVGSCSQPCRVFILDRDGNELDSFDSVDSTIDQSWESGQLEGAWIVIMPRDYMLTHVNFRLGPTEDPEMLFPWDINPMTGYVTTVPLIDGVSAEDYGPGLMYVVIAREVGPAIRYSLDIDDLAGGGVHIYDPMVKEGLDIPYGEEIDGYLIAPVVFQKGESIVEIACDDDCRVYFIRESDGFWIDDDIVYKLESDDGFISETISVLEATPGWILITHEDFGGGAGVDIYVWPESPGS